MCLFDVVSYTSIFLMFSDFGFYITKVTDPTPGPGFAPPSLCSPIAPSSRLPTREGREAASSVANKAVAAPLPSRGGAGVGSVTIHHTLCLLNHDLFAIVDVDAGGGGLGLQAATVEGVPL